MQHTKNLLLTIAVAAALQGCDQPNNSTVAAASQLSTYAVHVPERQDDFAWENDLVAFRAYGPAARDKPENSGIDAWLKYVNYPIVDLRYQRHFNEDKSYHKDWGDGYDIYHVGSSAGLGSTSLWLDGQRIGMETWVSYEILEQSREKTSFVLNYAIEVDNSRYEEKRLVSIELGSQLFEVQSTFYKDGQVAAGLPIAVGVTTHDEKAKAVIDEQTGTVATWEVLNDGFGIGTGVRVDPGVVQSTETILSDGVRDKGHALLIATTDENGQLEYSAGFGWQRAGLIGDFQQWQDYLNHYSK